MIIPNETVLRAPGEVSFRALPEAQGRPNGVIQYEHPEGERGDAGDATECPHRRRTLNNPDSHRERHDKSQAERLRYLTGTRTWALRAVTADDGDRLLHARKHCVQQPCSRSREAAPAARARSAPPAHPFRHRRGGQWKAHCFGRTADGAGARKADQGCRPCVRRLLA